MQSYHHKQLFWVIKLIHKLHFMAQVPKTNLTISVGKYCTIFQAEIFAILSCAQRGIEQGYKNKHILILSDSQAALKALDSYQWYGIDFKNY